MKPQVLYYSRISGCCCCRGSSNDGADRLLANKTKRPYKSLDSLVSEVNQDEIVPTREDLF